MKWVYAFFLLFYVILEIVSAFWIGTTSVISDRISIWIYANANLDFFFPLFATIPFCWFFFSRHKNNFFNYISVRISLKRYVLYMLLSVALLSFFMSFIVHVIGVFWSLYMVDPAVTGPTHFTLPFLPMGISISHPLAYGFVGSLWKSLVFVLLTITGCIISLLTKNIFIANFAVFVYVLVESLIATILLKPEWGIVTSFIIGRLGNASYNSYTMLIGIGGLLLFLSIGVAISTKKGELRTHA